MRIYVRGNPSVTRTPVLNGARAGHWGFSGIGSHALVMVGGSICLQLLMPYEER